MKLNKFCKKCEYEHEDKITSQPCDRCAGVHRWSNQLYFKHKGCKFCNGAKRIKDDNIEIVMSDGKYLEIETFGLPHDTSYVDAKFCFKCGNKLSDS